MKKLIGNLVLCLIILLCIASCVKPTNFSTTPNISFKEYHQYKNVAGKDTSLDIVTHFEDGDGDIGYLDNEFIKCNAPQNNLFIYYERKQGNNFAPVIFYDPWAELNDQCDTIALHDSLQLHFENRMTFIQPSGSNKSIEGDVTYHLSETFVKFLFPYQVNTAQGRFRIYMIDRAGHKSNEIITADLNINR